MLNYPHNGEIYSVEPLPNRNPNTQDEYLKIPEMTGRQRRCLGEYWAPIFYGVKEIYNLSDCAGVIINNLSVATKNQLAELEHVYKERERCQIPVTIGALNLWMSCHRS